MKSRRLKPVKRTVMRPVASSGRKSNEAYRIREHLTEAEVGKLLKALKANRHGHRDWLIGLLRDNSDDAFRSGSAAHAQRNQQPCQRRT